MTAALEGCEWSAARPGRTLPPGKSRYPFYRRLGGPQGRSGRAENLVPTGIRSRTVQPAVSRYTDWGTRPTLFSGTSWNLRRHEQHASTNFCVSSSVVSVLMNNILTKLGFNSKWRERPHSASGHTIRRPSLSAMGNTNCVDDRLTII